jgi:cytochrome c biogenesis protein CcmG/thiol:disulfide interchange protein DsbE
MRTLLVKRWTLVSILILVLSAVWVWMSVAPPGNTTAGAIPAPQEGFQAPDFELSTLDGDTIVLSELRGKAILLNFWATWCPPCRSEMPAMQQVSADYDDNKFVVLAVNNTQQDSREAVEAFILERELTFPVLLDNNGDVAARYQVHSMPTTFFIDPDGIIQEVVIGGPMSEALLRTRVESLIGEEN